MIREHRLQEPQDLVGSLEIPWEGWKGSDEGVK